MGLRPKAPGSEHVPKTSGLMLLVLSNLATCANGSVLAALLTGGYRWVAILAAEVALDRVDLAACEAKCSTFWKDTPRVVRQRYLTNA
jgi:hypothetical protein